MASRDFKDAADTRSHRLMRATPEVTAAFSENQKEAERTLAMLDSMHESSYAKDLETEKTELYQQQPKLTLDPFGIRKERRRVEVEKQAEINVKARYEKAKSNLEAFFVEKADKILGIEDFRDKPGEIEKWDGKPSPLGRHDLYNIPADGLNGRPATERNPIDWSGQRGEKFEKAMSLEVRERFNDNSKAAAENAL